MHDWNDDRIFERACTGLAKLGHDVTLIAPADDDMVMIGVKIIAIPQRGRLGKHLVGPWEAFWKMTAIKADIYHFYNPNLMLLMALWSLLGNKVCIDIHENYEVRVDNLSLPRLLKEPLVKFYRRMENWFCSFFDGITVVTDSMKSKLAPAGVDTLVVDNVPYLMRLEEIELSSEKANVPTIITSGSHSEARNCLKAVEALPMIVKEVPTVKMKFVGRFQPPEYESELHQRAKELGVSENLKTEGMLPWLDNFKRISSAHIGCVFYNDNLNNRVTLPNRLYEYMYCGMAVLGECFPEVEAVIKNANCGKAVNSQSPADIAKKAIALLSNKEQLARAGENARSAVLQQYNFENALQSLDEFYHKISEK